MPDHDVPRIIHAATPAAIRAASLLLKAGRLVAFPTETVYGLGADATNGQAVAQIFAAKGRPSFNPLIVHVTDINAAQQFVEFNDAALMMARAFWPGPLTLVLKKRPNSGISDLVSAGLDSIALRIPDHAIARALLAATGLPLAAPSANRSGHTSATRASHVAADLGARVAVILDGGPTAHGIESTIVDARSGTVTMLRPGAIPAETIEAVIGGQIGRSRGNAGQPTASGQLESHYAPNAHIRLNATEVADNEALLAFGPNIPATRGIVFNLSEKGDVIEAAANLFHGLRMLDAKGTSAIAVSPIPDHGLGEAINDRLRRAAAPRS